MQTLHAIYQAMPANGIAEISSAFVGGPLLLALDQAEGIYNGKTPDGFLTSACLSAVATAVQTVALGTFRVMFGLNSMNLLGLFFVKGVVPIAITSGLLYAVGDDKYQDCFQGNLLVLFVRTIANPLWNLLPSYIGDSLKVSFSLSQATWVNFAYMHS
jgi:hypothetical protein